MKIPVGLVALFFTTCAFAQNAPPKVGTKPLAQVKPSAPMGCKLVGAVKSIKIWAGDCTDAAQIRGATSATEAAPELSLSERAAGAIPGQKQ